MVWKVIVNFFNGNVYFFLSFINMWYFFMKIDEKNLLKDWNFVYYYVYL